MVLEIFFGDNVFFKGVLLEDFKCVDMWVQGMFFFIVINICFYYIYVIDVKQEGEGDVKEKI